MCTGIDFQGAGQIWMMNVVCDGSETNLDLCSFDWAPEGACNHSMDAVVECYGGTTPTGDASTPEQCTVNTLQELLTMARQELNNERDARLRVITGMQRSLSSLQHETDVLDNKLSSKYKMTDQWSM